MGLTQSVGTTLGVSAGWPATDDQAGYEALTFTNAGRPSTLPRFRGTKDVATFDDLATGDEIKLIDMKRGGNGAVNFGYEDADTGQDIFDAASEATDTPGSQVSILMTLTSGHQYYRKGVVTSYNPGVAVGSVVIAEVNIEFSAAGDVKVTP